jgi:hypothetical protein
LARRSVPLKSCRSPKCLIVEEFASEVPGSSHTLMKLHAALHSTKEIDMLSLSNKNWMKHKMHK